MTTVQTSSSTHEITYNGIQYEINNMAQESDDDDASPWYQIKKASLPYDGCIEVELWGHIGSWTVSLYMTEGELSPAEVELVIHSLREAQLLANYLNSQGLTVAMLEAEAL